MIFAGHAFLDLLYCPPPPVFTLLFTLQDMLLAFLFLHSLASHILFACVFILMSFMNMSNVRVAHLGFSSAVSHGDPFGGPPSSMAWR